MYAKLNMFANEGTQFPVPMKFKNPNLFSDCSRATGSSYNDLVFNRLKENINTFVYM